MWAVCLPSDILPENEVLFSLCSKHLFRGLEQGLALISQRDCFFKPGLHTFYTFDCFSNFCCQKIDITRLIYPYNKFHLPLFTSKKKKKKFENVLIVVTHIMNVYKNFMRLRLDFLFKVKIYDGGI